MCYFLSSVLDFSTAASLQLTALGQPVCDCRTALPLTAESKSINRYVNDFQKRLISNPRAYRPPPAPASAVLRAMSLGAGALPSGAAATGAGRPTEGRLPSGAPMFLMLPAARPSRPSAPFSSRGARSRPGRRRLLRVPALRRSGSTTHARPRQPLPRRCAPRRAFEEPASRMLRAAGGQAGCEGRSFGLHEGLYACALPAASLRSLRMLRARSRAGRR